jgi:hypothetical protein
MLQAFQLLKLGLLKLYGRDNADWPNQLPKRCTNLWY